MNLAHQLQCLQPSEPGHVHIKQGEVDRLVLHDLDGLFAVLGEHGTKALGLDDFAECLADPAIVVGDKDRVLLPHRYHVSPKSSRMPL